MITKDFKMADIIHLNHQTVSVLHRFGIDLGFGDITIEEVCTNNGLDTGFFLEIINAFLDKDYFPQKKLQSFSITLTVNYLKKTHEDYLEDKLPFIEKMIDQLISGSGKETAKFQLLKKFFIEYKEEFIAHLKREDEVVFPYALKVEKAYMEKKKTDIPENYSMENFTVEHSNIEEKLTDLKNIIIKYLPPVGHRKLCSSILNELFTLEKDLVDHSRIEEKIMAPKVIEMEKYLSGLNS
jgi:regulator of cell morphogenesis and NO signaling